jgi:hypothetical protein
MGLFQQTQAISQLCAFYSPKTGILSAMGIYRQLTALFAKHPRVKNLIQPGLTL